MPWRLYNEECPECQIRCIANMTPPEKRSSIYERIERECGSHALATVKERVGLEVIRMRLLREGMKK